MNLTRVIREITGMTLMVIAGAYQERSEYVTGHITVQSIVISAVIIITGRVIFG